MNTALKASARAALLVALVAAVMLLAAACGDEMRAIPKVTGDDSNVYEAYERLSAAGFKVEITDDFRTGPSCECENALIEQWPPAGTRAKSGSTVEITVGGPGQLRSDGVRAAPPYRQLDLPNFVGLRLDSVDGWLAAHDMGWSADLPRLPATKGKDLLDAYVVSAQEPKGGDYVESGDSVEPGRRSDKREPGSVAREDRRRSARERRPRPRQRVSTACTPEASPLPRIDHFPTAPISGSSGKGRGPGQRWNAGRL